MRLVRLYNLICGIFLGFAALAFLASALMGLARYAEEPEDVWLSTIWIVLLVTLAGLCFSNAYRSTELTILSWHTAANLIAVLAMGSILIVGQRDPTVVVLSLFNIPSHLSALLVPSLVAQS